MLDPILTDLGLAIYDMELSFAKRPKLHIRAERRTKQDARDGVTVGELQRLSRQLDNALELDPVLGEDYALEVSSPGLERKLKTPEHVMAAIGEVLEVVPSRPVGGRQLLAGKLTAFEDGVLTLEAETGSATIDFKDVRKARTVFR